MTEVYGESLMQAAEKQWFIDNLPKNALYLEVGSYAGASAAEILDARPDVIAVCVDPFVGDGGDGNGSLNDEHRINFVKNCAARSDRMLGYVGTLRTLHMLLKSRQLFDLIFIDGSHSEDACYSDLEEARHLLVYDGVIVVHDYHSLVESHQGIKRAVQSFMINFRWVIFYNVNLSVMLRKERIHT